MKVIVLGNEKGGSGKTTIAIHIIVSLLREGYKVGSLDLDGRQATLTRYLEQRACNTASLPMPEHLCLLDNDKVPPHHLLDHAFDTLAQKDFVIVDTPGHMSPLGRAGHAYADVLITPLNDSFLDIDVLASIDMATYEVVRPNQYAQAVFAQKIERAKRLNVQKTFDWVVVRNRLSHHTSRNTKATQKALDNLSKRIGVRVFRGFGERVIFRELFLEGLTLLDLGKGSAISMGLSHVAARQEIRGLLQDIALTRAT